MNRTRLIQATDQLAAYLRFQRLLGVEGMTLSEQARQALEGLDRPATPAATKPGRSAVEAAPGRPDLKRLAAEAAGCERCDLHRFRTQVVFGEGDPEAELMFIGEGPGADEDRTGRPFVGRAGRLLTDIITAMGFKREEVYIANIVKCRPPNNRAPEPTEAEACRPWLDAQIEAVAPRAIVALGASAARYLLGVQTPISALRGAFRDLGGIPVMPTFHPAYLLRNYNRDSRGKVWSDVKQVMELLGKKPPGR